MQGLYRVSTNNKEEAIRTGKVYLGIQFYHCIGNIMVKNNKKCNNCNVVLSFIRDEYNNKIDYCIECNPYSKFIRINKKR